MEKTQMNPLSPRRMTLFALLLWTSACFAQSQQQSDMVQQKLQQMQQATARNEKQLHTYQWIETATVTLDGNTKPPRQSICRYTSDGTLQKTPLGAPPQPPAARGGPFRKMMVEKKIEDAQNEIVQVHALVGMYLPPNQEKLRQAFAASRMTFEKNRAGGDAIVIHDYAKPGDELSLVLNTSTMQIQHITVKTYFDRPKDTLTAEVDFASLADGTLYASMTTVNTPSKKLSLTTVSSDFSKAVY
jgi:hypothetical protein